MYDSKIIFPIKIRLSKEYKSRQPTISSHQETIRNLLGLNRYTAEQEKKLRDFLFSSSLQLEQTTALLSRAKEFLRDCKVIQPSDDTLIRLLVNQRKSARLHIYQRIAKMTQNSYKKNAKDKTSRPSHRS